MAAVQQFQQESGKKEPTQMWEYARIVKLSKLYYKQFKEQ